MPAPERIVQDLQHSTEELRRIYRDLGDEMQELRRQYQDLSEDYRNISGLVTKSNEEGAVMSAVLGRLEKSLFGNGQPGLMQRLGDRIDELEKLKDNSSGAEAQKKRDWQSLIQTFGIIGTLAAVVGHLLGLGASMHQAAGSVVQQIAK